MTWREYRVRVDYPKKSTLQWVRACSMRDADWRAQKRWGGVHAKANAITFEVLGPVDGDDHEAMKAEAEEKFPGMGWEVVE